MALFSLLLLAALMSQISYSASALVGIVNGTEAQPHSRPYMVSLQIDGHHKCGGFLINDEFVMTAAHCWQDQMDMTAVLGAHNLSTKDFESISVKTEYIHPEFKITSPSNDIMLLKLAKPVQYTKYISCIFISNNSNSSKQSTCSVAGWGSTEDNGTASNVLLEADVRILNSKVCKDHWKFENILCAGGIHHGICQGDSGGPLVCDNTAVGIASFVDNCSHPRKPNGYTDISKYLPWIHEIINSASLCQHGIL